MTEQLAQSEKMDALARLAGGVAHDFNNLLTAIAGYSDILLDRLQQVDDVGEGPLRDLEQIRAAADRATTLTRQLLAFSRRQPLESHVLELGALVRGVEQRLRRLVGEDVRLVVRTPAEPAFVRADRARLEQVIVNLAVNAEEAMPHGGTLTIETGASDQDVTLAVTDTGCGMDGLTLDRAFEPFFSTKEKRPGLGLSTVYGIVAQSGGQVRADSEPGRGSTFRVQLPRAAAAEARAKTILLVEDEQMVSRLASTVLADEGYAVLNAAHGDDALRLCKLHDGKIDLVLTDVVMPTMTGPELATRLAWQHSGPKVLFMSGYTDDAIVRPSIAGSGIAFLQKPFTPDALRRKVREVLDAP